MNDVTTNTNLMLNTAALVQIQQVANSMAEGTVMVPEHFRGKPADCLAICMQAAQWGMNPYTVAQKTHIVGKTLGYEGQLINGVISSSKAITGRFKYEYGGEWPHGKDAFVRVGAVIHGDNDITWGEPLYIANVTIKNSPLWKTAPKQQSAYLAVKYWARLYCPDVILGVYSKEELETQPIERDITKKGETLDNILGKVGTSEVESNNNNVIEESDNSKTLTIGEMLETITHATSVELDQLKIKIPTLPFEESEMHQLRQAFMKRQKDIKNNA